MRVQLGQSAEVSARAHRGKYGVCGDGLLRLGDDCEALCGNGRIRAGGYAEFGKDRRDVSFDRPRREKEVVGDLLVAVATGEKRDDFDLPLGQFGRVRACRWSRSSRNSACAKLPKAASHRDRARMGTELFKRGEREV
jgi:hypothetical protein